MFERRIYHTIEDIEQQTAVSGKDKISLQESIHG